MKNIVENIVIINNLVTIFVVLKNNILINHIQTNGKAKIYL